MPVLPALVGCFIVGKRVGYGKDNMAPHSMTLTMVGASMLWVGWFGFNVGSNLEATAGATLAMINTFVCTAAAVLSWSAVEIDDPRQGLDARRSVRHGCRPGRHHPGLRHHRPGRCHRARHRRQPGLLLLRGDREGQVRL